MYMYNWITLLYTWNPVNQLYFNKKTIKNYEAATEMVTQKIFKDTERHSQYPAKWKADNKL